MPFPGTAGDIVRFTYVKEGPDKFKEVFVIHPNWNGKVHAIDMRRLTEAERVVLKTIMDPKAKGKTHRIPLVNDILRRMDPLTLINNPISFYNQFVKQFLKNKDAYRTYSHPKISGAQIIKDAAVKGPITNPKPLFGKPLGES